MAIQRWDPLGDVMQLRRRVNGLFEEVLSRSAAAVGDDGAASEDWRPPMDLHEEPQRYVLRADLPGVAAADIDVRIDDGRLVLSGERKPDPGIPRESFLRVERPLGRFSIELKLPDSVEARSIRAVQRDGVVEVTLPKRRPDQGPGRITVEVK